MATVFAGEDHHVVLGVGPDASQAQIKRAYYGLARVLHPDKNANEPEEATKMMQRVNEAFQALTPAKTCRSCEPYGSPAFQRMTGGRRGNPGVPGRFPDCGGIRVESMTLQTPAVAQMKLTSPQLLRGCRGRTTLVRRYFHYSATLACLSRRPAALLTRKGSMILRI